MMAPETSAAAPAAERRAVLITTTLAAFFTPFMGSSVNIALPSIAERFSADAVSLNWVAAVYILTAAIFLVPLGKAADMRGRKKVFALGTLVFTLASIACAQAPSLPLFLAARAVQGAGAAGQFGTGVAILSSVYPPGQRGKMLGINVAATYTGLSLGPFIGGILTGSLGWQSIFLINAVGGLTVLLLVFFRIRSEWAEDSNQKFDFIGAAAYAAALACLMLGLVLVPAAQAFPAFGAGALALVLFIARELRCSHPVLNLALFRNNRAFTFSNLAALINYAATFAVAFLISLYLQYVKGMSPALAGTVLVVQPAMQAVFSPLAGRLSDRFEARLLASLGMGFCASGLALLSTFHEGTGLALVIGSLALLGFGFGLFSSPNTNAIMGSVERRNYGLASALTGTMRLFGQMLSMGFVMATFNLIMGRVKLTPEVFPEFILSMRVIFGVSALLCFAGIFASLARGGRHSAEKSIR